MYRLCLRFVKDRSESSCRLNGEDTELMYNKHLGV